MCCVWLPWLSLLVVAVDGEPLDDEPVDGDDVLIEKSGIGIGCGLRRSSGMAGGGTGGRPLINSGPLALFSSVDHPPLPSVDPMLHDT